MCRGKEAGRTGRMRSALPCMHREAGGQPGVTPSPTDPRVSALTPFQPLLHTPVSVEHPKNRWEKLQILLLFIIQK